MNKNYAVYYNGKFEGYQTESGAIKRALKVKKENACDVIVFKYFDDEGCYFAIKTV